MAQRIVRQIEEKAVKQLKRRRILQESLLGKAAKRTSFKEALLAMPNVGKDEDFKRGQ